MGKFASVCLILAYWGALALASGLKSDHIFVGMVFVVLFWGGELFRGARRFLVPLILTAIVYDGQRFIAEYIRGEIHVIEPYLFDRGLFGIRTATGTLTPNEWWQLHTTPALDFLAGLAYLTYVGEFLAIAALLRSRRMMWAFFALNLAGYATYYLYPAAPPWYVAEYGFGEAQTWVQPSLAGCVRFDAMTGLDLFQAWYGKSADVFGAIPSLHVAYPLLAAYFAFRARKYRAASTIFYLWMCFSAVYLNHHYILDLIWGSVYALVCGVLAEKISISKLTRRADLPSMATSNRARESLVGADRASRSISLPERNKAMQPSRQSMPQSPS